MNLESLGAVLMGLSGFGSLLSVGQHGAEHSYRYSNLARRVVAVNALLTFGGAIVILFYLSERASETATVFGLLGCAVSCVASLAFFFFFLQKVVCLRPIDWEHIGAFEWWRRMGDLEIITPGIGGALRDTWACPRFRVFNHTEFPLLVQRVELQAGQKMYAAKFDSSKSQVPTVAPGEDEWMTFRFDFGRPLTEICQVAQHLRLELKVGEEIREIPIPLECR